ncbi:Y-family DNA polymerase [Escherichia coli]|uniref:Y-family DNA polymerase n=1 Tax=Escherichia coli TaxID=562 RepID=UPI001AB04A23|nr:Y-family DNA polymerase [Escherichia coli]MBO3239477.1 Y-family DNA polymerase [Escherichia coli]
MFALCDVNSFYASCETVFRPDLRGRPVVVLSNNDGCVIARSAEAKQIGITMGEPYFKQRDLFRRHNVATFSSNYELYADMSNRVMTTLEEMSPRVEIYSIDEAFCDLTGVRNCRVLEEFGREMRATVLQHTHLTVGVGIAPTKTLAKLANHAAKKWQRQTGGVVDLSNVDRQRRLMALVPVEDVWGVGRRISKKLNAMGIKTALELSEQSTWIIRKHFNVVLERTVRELRGEPCLELEEFAPAKQEIVCSRSFGSRITDYEEMRQAICSYAARAAEKLRGEHQYCRFISAFVKTSPFAQNEPYYGNSASIKLLTPTQDSRDIIGAATRCLDAIWRDGHRYQKAGVMLGDFFSQGVAQLNLFDDNAPRAGSETLMMLLDQLNAKEGKGTLYFAGQGIQQQWQMKREMLSPRYTTRFSDLLIVK